MTAPTRIRQPAVSGLFYPGEASELAAAVDALLDGAPDHGLTPKALVVPHAGYVYSGPVAASAYSGLRRLGNRIRRVVLAGPAHRAPVEGIALPAAEGFATPLGVVPVDEDGRRALCDLPTVVVDDGPHLPEHSLEVHLPFLQRLFGEQVAVLPLAVGRAGAADVADVLERVWGGDDTLVVVSTDLSHQLDYETARCVDAGTARAIEQLRVEDIPGDAACGLRPLAGLLTVARRRAMDVSTLDLRNSGDTEGDRARVVGYGAWAFVESRRPPLDETEGATLLEVARDAVTHGTRNRLRGPLALGSLPARLLLRQAAFVTLGGASGLRGCIGGVEAVDPLAEAAAHAAHGAATSDPRFAPIGTVEARSLPLKVSALSRLDRLAADGWDHLVASLVPGRDGLVLVDGSARSVFLPAVWELLPEPSSFVGRLMEKAGLPARHWSTTLAAYRFDVQTLG